MKSKSIIKQAGFTLLELMAVLAIGILLVVGALALRNSANSQQSSIQMISDLSAIKESTKSLYFGQGGYGAASLNATLITANKIPTTMPITGGTTINHALNGTLTITGATSAFTMTLTNIPTDVCVSLLSAASGFTSIQVGANAARTSFPISPTNAATDCGAAANQTIVFTAV